METGSKVLVGFVVGVFLLVVVFALLPFTQVGAGERAIVLRLGKVDRVLDSGIHWVTPFVENVETIDVRTQAHKVSASAASADLQSASTEITINYALNTGTLGTLWTTLGKDYVLKVLDPSAQEAVKAATAKYTANDLVTKRELVKDDILNLLREGVNRKANGLITLTDISITNFQFSASFEQAIESKVKAEQDALTAKNKLAQVQYEAQQKVATAEADAKSISLQSAAANNEKYVSLKALEVQLEFAKRWDGKLPVNLYGSAPIPFLNLSK